MKTKFKYVKMVRNPHTGAARYFFRPRGHKAIRLPDALGSHDFIIEHARLLREFEGQRQIVEELGSPDAPGVRPVPDHIHFLPGSIASFAEEYRQSREFKNKAPMTQYNYGKALDFLIARRGAQRLDEATVKHLNAYIRTIKSDSGADLQVQMISLLWEFAKGSEHFKGDDLPNPALSVKKRYAVKNGGHQEWTAEIEQEFLASAKPYVQLLYHLLRETGARLGDVCNMRWSDYDGDTITILATEKTGEQVFVAVSEKLRSVLDAVPHECEWIVSKNGKQLKKGTLSHVIGRALTKIGYGRRGTAKKTFSAHGLRKNFASDLAMNGANVAAMQAALGHRTPKMSLYYAQQADKKRLALEAVERLNAGRRRAAAVAEEGVIDMTAIRRRAG